MSEASSQQRNVAREILGYSGRMISISKSAYGRAHPRNVVVFNANICTRAHGKIWHGDLDVTKDASMLMKLAVDLGEDVYVLREYDARFETQANPLLDRACAIATASTVRILE